MKSIFFFMIYLGTSGWYYDHWMNKFYPSSLEKREWLGFYCEYFNTVEVNSSFYRMPFPSMVKGWHPKSPKNFSLTFKGNRVITHERKLRNVDAPLKKFYSFTEVAKEKRGAILWQIPPSLHRDDELLDEFLERLSPDIDQFIEFRHQS